MNVKYSNLLITFSAVILLSYSTQAQEETQFIEGPDPTHREINFNEDKTLIYDQPGHTTVVRDTVHQSSRPMIKTKPEQPKESQKGKNEGDALNFNFLYYMIQKFKLSDLVDR